MGGGEEENVPLVVSIWGGGGECAPSCAYHQRHETLIVLIVRNIVSTLRILNDDLQWCNIS